MSQETLEQSAPSATNSTSASLSESKQTKQTRQDATSLTKEEIFIVLKDATFDQAKAIIGDELNDENIDFLIAWFKQDITEMISCIKEGAFLSAVYTWFAEEFNNQKLSKENAGHRYDMLELFEFVNTCNEVQDANGKELFFAVLKGDEKAVNDLFKRGVSPNVKDAKEQLLSPLVIAAWQWDRYTDHEEIANRYVRIGGSLLKRGANAVQTQQWVDALCEQSASNRIKHDIWQGISELTAEFVTACSPVEFKASSSSSVSRRQPLTPLQPQSMSPWTPEFKFVAGKQSSGQKPQVARTPGHKKIIRRIWEVRSFSKVECF
jgi:hypothetical protein